MAQKQGDRARLRVVFNDVDLDTGEPPPLAAYLVDETGKLVRRAEIDAKGEVQLQPADLGRAAEVVIGAATAKDHTELDQKAVLRFYAGEIAELIKTNGILEVDKADWVRFRAIRVCVDGSVSACRYRPWLFEEMVLDASPLKFASVERLAEAGVATTRQLGRVSATIAASAFHPRFPFPVCSDICHGLVEVYRRVCCCEPIIVRDPRLSELLRRLQELVKQRPPIIWPPPPPPPPFFEGDPRVAEQFGIDQAPEGALTGGAMNMSMVMAERDVFALQTLDAAEIPAYIAEREYLRPFWCSCGAPTRAAEGTLRPDGTFSICWGEPLTYYRPGCHEEFAFVVRQIVNGQTIVVYDGLAANQWFRSRTGIHIQTYDRRAVACDQPETPDDGTAFVMLEKIGGTLAYRLATPDQDSWDGVQLPDDNGGLLDAAPSAAAARGNSLRSNWGGTLALTYKFSDEMRTIGARYYRISVVAANPMGHPTGARTALQGGLAWLWYDYPAPYVISIQSESLGPVPPATVGGQNNLYRIPYRADHDWMWSYHGLLDTTAFPQGRYLVMLEVFGNAGNQLRPAGSSGPGTNANFTNRRWFQPLGPTANVPFAALTHMFLWDNRPAVARIVDLRLGTGISTDECQFLVGTPTSDFSVGYRAYHPDPRFIYNHSMGWHRGLGGSSGSLVSSPDNAGQFIEAVTPAVTFQSMLGPHNRCSFSLDLDVSVKTTNGSGPLLGLYAHDQAAFALED